MSQLESLKQYTTVVADTGDIQAIAKFKPRDATTNPSLILKAVQQDDYRHILEDAVAAHKGEPLDAIVDQVLVRFGREILTEAARHSPELAVAMETWKEIKFEFDTVDKLDVA